VLGDPLPERQVDWPRLLLPQREPLRRGGVPLGRLALHLVQRLDLLERGRRAQVSAVECLDEVPSRASQLRQLDDDLVRARAIETAEKLDVVEAYDMLRKQLAAYEPKRVIEFMPVPPSTAVKLALEKFDFRVSQAISDLKGLPEDHPVRRNFLPALEREFAEFQTADTAEDVVRRNLATARLALTTLKVELAQARDRELGQIQIIFGDRSKLEFFTLPWRTFAPAKKEDPASTPA
jgi:hypothetical protein